MSSFIYIKAEMQVMGYQVDPVIIFYIRGVFFFFRRNFLYIFLEIFLTSSGVF